MLHVLLNVLIFFFAASLGASKQSSVQVDARQPAESTLEIQGVAQMVDSRESCYVASAEGADEESVPSEQMDHSKIDSEQTTIVFTSESHNVVWREGVSKFATMFSVDPSTASVGYGSLLFVFYNNVMLSVYRIEDRRVLNVATYQMEDPYFLLQPQKGRGATLTIHPVEGTKSLTVDLSTLRKR